MVDLQNGKYLIHGGRTHLGRPQYGSDIFTPYEAQKLQSAENAELFADPRISSILKLLPGNWVVPRVRTSRKIETINKKGTDVFVKLRMSERIE